MNTRIRDLGSDLAKVDVYENTAADYEEIPEIDDAFIERARKRGTLFVEPGAPSDAITNQARKTHSSRGP